MGVIEAAKKFVQNLSKSDHFLSIDESGNPRYPRVRVSSTINDSVASETHFTSGKPDESLAPSTSEIKDLIAMMPTLPYVFAAVHKIASSAAMVPLVMYESVRDDEIPEVNVPANYVNVSKRAYFKKDVRKQGDVGGEDEFVSNITLGYRELPILFHPLLSLLKRPNSRQTTTKLMYSTYAYLELTGNCYWLLGRDEWGDINEIVIPRPDRIYPQVKNKPDYLRVKEGGQEKLWSYDDVIHFSYFHPFSDIFGMGPLRSAMRSLTTDFYCIAYNESFFKNSARPDILLLTENILDEATLKRVVAEWERAYSGVLRAHRPAVLEGGMKVELLTKTNQKDFEFIEQRKRNREDILSALGVDPVLVGIREDSITADAFLEIRRQFWEETVLPKMANVAETIETFLFPRIHPVKPEIMNIVMALEAQRRNIVEGDAANQAQLAYEVRSKVTPLEEELDRFKIRYDTRGVRALRDAAQVESQVRLRDITTGYKSINEIRAENNLPPLPWGDDPPMTNYPVGGALTRGDNNENRSAIEPIHGVGPKDVMAQDDETYNNANKLLDKSTGNGKGELPEKRVILPRELVEEVLRGN